MTPKVNSRNIGKLTRFFLHLYYKTQGSSQPMKKILFTLLLMLITLIAGAQTDKETIMPLWPKCKTYEVSIARFRNWFARAYVQQLELYRKGHKEIYKQQKLDMQDCMVTFIIETDGSMTIHKTTPEQLCMMQQIVIENTMRDAPKWVPASQEDHPVRIKLTIPLSHTQDFRDYYHYPSKNRDNRYSNQDLRNALRNTHESQRAF